MSNKFKPEEAIEFLSEKLVESGCSQCGNLELQELNFFHPKWYPVKEFYEMLNDEKFETLDSMKSYIQNKKFDVLCSKCLQKLVS